jgi:hypothetical protein
MCRRAGRRAFRAKSGRGLGKTNRAFRPFRPCKPIRSLLLKCWDDGDRRNGLGRARLRAEGLGEA